MALDGAAQAYVTGMTDSPNFPTASPLEGTLGAPPNADAFLAKLAPSGDSLVYSTYLGAKGGSGVAVDADENPYVTGGGVLSAKLDGSGSALLYAFWALGGSAIAVDESGAAYVTGGTYSNLLPTMNASQPRNGGMFSARGRDDAFLVKISDAPAPPPAIEEDDGRVSYTGTWAVDQAPGHSGGHAVFSDEAGATATITFTGTGIQLVGRREEFSGYANITTGFTIWGAVDTYASPAQDQSLILSITGLASDTHSLTVTVGGGHNVRSLGNRVWIDGFNVIGAPEPEPTPSPTPEPTPTPTPSPTPAPTTRIEDADLLSVSYSGAWSLNVQTGHSAGTAMLSMDAGARATVSFSGTGVRWIGLRDQMSGIAAVYLDGVIAGSIDTYASPSEHQAVLFSIDGLTAGAHTLAIEATGTRGEASGGSWVWVDAFDVVDGVGTPTIPSPPPPTTRIEDADLLSVSYSGAWSLNVQTGHSAGTAMLSMDAGARATVRFSGTGVRWIGLRDQMSGIAAVYLDGDLAGSVDTYASPSEHQAVLFSIDGLTPGAHTLAIEATGTHGEASGGSWVWVDAFDVVDGVGTPTIPSPPLPFSTLRSSIRQDTVIRWEPIP